MTQSFDCPNCGAPLDDQKSGEATFRCPYCNTSVIVPDTLRTGPKGDTMFHGAVLDGSIPSIIRSIDPLAHVKELTEIARLAREGKKIEAVKLYRETFDTNLLDAKNAVEALERGEPIKFSKKITYSLTQPIQTVQPIPVTQANPMGNLAAQVKKKRRSSVLLLAGFLLLLGLGVFIFIATESPSGGSGSPSNRVGVLTEVATLKAEAGNLFVPTLSFGDATLLLSFGAKGINPGQFDDARPIAVDSEGAIYIAEYHSGRVQVFDPEGKFVTQWNTGSQKSYVLSMSVDFHGIISVVQSGDLLRFNGETGEVVNVVKNGGVDKLVTYCFATPVGGFGVVTADEDIWIFDPQGKQTIQIAKSVSSISQKSELTSHVTVDGQGNIYILGIFNNAVFKYSPEGKFLNQFGGEGDEKGQFRAPQEIAVDGQDRVYVSDIKGVQIFDRNGRYMGVIKFDGVALGLTVDRQDNLFVVSNQPKVYKFKVTVNP